MGENYQHPLINSILRVSVTKELYFVPTTIASTIEVNHSVNGSSFVSLPRPKCFDSKFFYNFSPMPNIPQWLICHHSFTPLTIKNDASEASFNTSHKERGFPQSRSGWYIGYHKVIYSTGEVRQYREDDEVGAHCKEQLMNFHSIGICLEGNFDVEDPTPEQKKALFAEIKAYQKKYSIPDTKVVPHRFFATGEEKNTTPFKTFTGLKPYKSCWGNKLPDDIVGYLKEFGPSLPEPAPSVPHFAADEEKFFMDTYGISKKNLDAPAPWGEVLVLLKRIYDDLKR